MEVAEIVAMADRKAAYVELARRYGGGTDSERRAIIDAWDYGVPWQRPALHRLACRRGESAPPGERIVAELLFGAIASRKRLICEPETDRAEYERAKALGMKTIDYRDELVRLAHLYNSAAIANLNGNRLFLEAAACSPQPVARFLEQFANRSEDLKSMVMFGMAAVVNADGETELHFRGF